MSKIKLVAALALALGVTGPGNAASDGSPPFSDLQGMWYDTRYKVAVELQGHEVIVREIDTQNITIKRHNWSKGQVIARYSAAKQEGETYRFSGECWEFGTEKLVSVCLDNATHFNRPGTKPFWALHAAGMTLWRRDKFPDSHWGSRD